MATTYSHPTVFGADVFPGRFIEAAMEGLERPDLFVINAAKGVDLSEPVETLRSASERYDVVVITQPDSPALPDMAEISGRHCLTVLHCPYMIGTHMTGLWRNVVNSIYRGWYDHLKDNGCRRSVLHALDAGRAAIASAGVGGEFNLSDGSDPLFEDVAEALSIRLDHKRIPTLSPGKWRFVRRVAKLFGFKKMTSVMEAQSTDCVLDCSAWQSRFPDFVFTNVINYLSTHQYGTEDI